MTKKHFIALADYIRDHRDLFDDVHIWHLANFCKSQNPKFKWFRWTAYIRGECGPNGGRIRRRTRFGEVTHHLDGNPQNNNPANLLTTTIRNERPVCCRMGSLNQDNDYEEAEFT